ncbi:hypothetical protein GCM10009817_20960 [Terrabacter lapilli]|uniref:Uncharacterized protein n=1 Tax=Terrabacter lapilli TaxID=436231 RepID=A0ABP5DJS4_9MICO
MSISIVLLPLAVAAVSAWQASHQDTDAEGRTVCQVQTRMKDQELLGAALRDTQADVSASTDKLVARWQGVEAEFRRDAQGIWQANFTGNVDVGGAAAIVAAVDAAYGRQVQQAVLAKLRDRAPAAGMFVASETVEDDDSVTLVLDVRNSA